MMAGMAALQVLVVRFFFQGARKGKRKYSRLRDGADENRLRVNATIYASRSNLWDQLVWDVQKSLILCQKYGYHCQAAVPVRWYTTSPDDLPAPWQGHESGLSG